MEASIFGTIELDFTDDEVRQFLINQGYKIEWGKDTVKDFPFGVREIECEVAYKDGTHPCEYRKLFTLRTNHLGSKFIHELGESNEIKDRLKSIILSNQP
jgi:hypothetical protein